MAIQPTLFDTTEWESQLVPRPRSSRFSATGPQAIAQPFGSQRPTCCDEPASKEKPASEEKPAAASDLVSQLRHQIGCVTTRSTAAETFTTGSRSLNRWLPRGGLRADGITEWVAESAGSGAASLAMIAASARLQTAAGPLVVVGGPGTFYPPAAVSLGIPEDRLVWVQPPRRADLIWAIDQALRCESIAAVWAHVGPHLDDRDARRFQLAAEIGHTPGLFIRPAAVRGRPSFTDVRFHVRGQVHVNGQVDVAGNRPAASVPRQTRMLQITLDRCRGGVAGQRALIEIDEQARIREIVSEPSEVTQTSRSLKPANHHDSATVRLAAELARATSTSVASRRRA